MSDDFLRLKGMLLTPTVQVDQVGRLELHAGDVLVVMVPEGTRIRDIEAIGDGLTNVLPKDVKLAIVDKPLSFFALGIADKNE